jgi:type IV pilus assembly protein PilW
VELGVDDLSETGDPVDYSAAVDWADPDTRTSATNRGDGVPDDAYVHCTTAVPCVVGDLANVTAVRLYVLARSRDASQGTVDAKTYTLGDTMLGPFNDAFQRHLFVSTIRLPNISGRRITP